MKYAHIEEVETIEEVQKFNPYHDARGRFTSANSAASMTWSPGKSKAHDKAIDREKKRQASGGADSESSNKYAGRFKDGTDEQLRTAEKNLQRNIERSKNGIASAAYVDPARRKDHLSHHENTLKELQAQQKELIREMGRRGMKPNIN